MIRQLLQEHIVRVAGQPADILIPTDPKLGDYATNISFVLAKQQGKKPAEVAGELALSLSKGELVSVVDIQVAPNGFLNFFLKPKFVHEQLKEISNDENYGKNKSMSGKTVMVEYTDPNPFKLFH